MCVCVCVYVRVREGMRERERKRDGREKVFWWKRNESDATPNLTQTLEPIWQQSVADLHLMRARVDLLWVQAGEGEWMKAKTIGGNKTSSIS
jgi:hypothetical protein